MRIVFHGTQNKEFTKFSDENIGCGGDCNSILGIFFAEDPHLAAEYAGDGLVIGAAIQDNKTVMEDLEHHLFNGEILKRVNAEYILDGCEPFDYPPDFGSDDYKVFCSFAREYYLEQGVECLQYAHIGDDTQMCVALKAQHVEILCILTPQQAIELGEKLLKFDDFYDQDKRLKLIADNINQKRIKPKLSLTH